MGQEEAHLVAVARDRRVVEAQHVDSVVGRGYAPTMAVKRLTDEELVAMLELARKADSVELKLTVPAADHRTAIAGLGLDPLEAQIRQVFFFDTPELVLNAAGLVVRARRDPGSRRRHGRQASARRARRAFRPSFASRPNVGRRGGRHARRLRLLRVAEGEGRRDRRASGCERKRSDPQHLLQGAASLLRRARPGRASRSRTCRSSDRSSSSSRTSRRPSSDDDSPPSSGSTRTGRGSWSCRRSAPPRTRSRSPPRRGCSSPRRA